MNNEAKKAIVLLSGGQDSTTCLYWARREFGLDIIPIGFDYEQSHKVELFQAMKICNKLGLDYKVLKCQELLGGSSLTNHSDHNEKSSFNSELPASFTPGRNLLFLSIAAAMAARIGAKDIVTGVCETDYSGYPDCRFSFIKSMELTINEALGLYSSNRITIHTPLMYLSKAETWRLAKELGCLDIVIAHTMTDYNGDMTMHEWGMGNENNPATKLRVKGYFEAKERGWI
jgi:7-cyano-7-deazaguanine synthase